MQVTQHQTQREEMCNRHMNATMASCQMDMKAMMQPSAQIQRQIDAAKKSNNPAKMRAALNAAENKLNNMSVQMMPCMSMMKMIDRCGGMMNSMMRG